MANGQAPFASGAPLVDQLVSLHRYPALGEADLDAFITGPGLRVLFVTGDAVKLLDTVDIAVILPELCRHFGGRLAAGVLARAAESLVAARYGADVRPALVFFARGAHLGTIPRVRDWAEYVEKITAYLEIAESGLSPARKNGAIACAT